MKKGLWNLIGKVPVLVLAVAVGPVAMADGPMVPSGSATPPATPGQSGPIQTIAMDTNSYDTNMVPPAVPAPVAAPAAPCAPVCQPGCSFSSPGCSCGPEGGCTFSWSPDKWCNVGLGIRTSVNEVTSTANVSDRNYFAVDEARLFFTGKVTSVIGFEFNTDISGAGGYGFNSSTNLPDSIHLLDAIVKFEFNDYVNFWIGRMLPPNDRSDLSGPFFINGWDYPFVSNYFGTYEGRDDGAAYWGQYGGGQFKWQFGLYNGEGRENAGNDWPTGPSNAPNTNGNPEFVMRLVANLLDPEPGYYNASTYYGEKNIAAIGFSLTDQHNCLTDGVEYGNFFGWNFDFLLENKMTAFGSGTFEAAYYHYAVSNNVLNDNAGDAYLLFAGWLLPHEVGCCGFCGRFRPYVRYQKYDRDNEAFAATLGDAKSEYDLGTQFVIKGHNARFDLFYGHQELDGGGHDNLLKSGFQLIF
jgi:phosphate-selective porin O/P